MAQSERSHAARRADPTLPRGDLEARLEQREPRGGDVVQTGEHLRRTLASVQGITSRSDGDARLQHLRGELDQSLEVAKKVEHRIDSMLTRGRVQNLSGINNPK